MSELKKRIPNLSDFYSDKRVVAIMSDVPPVHSHDLVSIFMELVWNEPIRRCSHCGNLMAEGYLLGNQYACSDECRNALYDSEDAENARRLYLIDCYEIEPEEVAGMSADEIEKEYEGCEISDSFMYTEWY